MKKYFWFAVIVCLFVLAAALVFSLSRPEMQDGLAGVAQNGWDRAVAFGSRLVDAAKDFLKG